MFGGSIGHTVWTLVQEWTPSQVHDHERGYQSELQEYLDQQLNNSGDGFGAGFGGGESESHYVSTERGTSYGDVVVDDAVGIELKRNFSNSQKRKLRGQLEDYTEEYDFVIACACGIEDVDGWREVENKFEQGRGGFGDVTEHRFIIKRRENFGQSSEDKGEGGLFDGDGGIF